MRQRILSLKIIKKLNFFFFDLVVLRILVLIDFVHVVIVLIFLKAFRKSNIVFTRIFFVFLDYVDAFFTLSKSFNVLIVLI